VKPLTVVVSSSLLLLIAAGALYATAIRAFAQSAARSLTYTETEAEAGCVIYSQQCASCHGRNLDDGAYGPPLTGGALRQQWGSRPLDG